METSLTTSLHPRLDTLAGQPDPGELVRCSKLLPFQNSGVCCTSGRLKVSSCPVSQVYWQFSQPHGFLVRLSPWDSNWFNSVKCSGASDPDFDSWRSQNTDEWQQQRITTRNYMHPIYKALENIKSCKYVQLTSDMFGLSFVLVFDVNPQTGKNQD